MIIYITENCQEKTPTVWSNWYNDVYDLFEKYIFENISSVHNRQSKVYYSWVSKNIKLYAINRITCAMNVSLPTMISFIPW